MLLFYRLSDRYKKFYHWELLPFHIEVCVLHLNGSITNNITQCRSNYIFDLSIYVDDAGAEGGTVLMQITQDMLLAYCRNDEICSQQKLRQLSNTLKAFLRQE